MKDDVLTISATKFKAECLDLFRKLETRKYSRVVVTRRGKPVAELTPPRRRVQSPWGAMRGTVKIPKGVDLTAPTFDEPFDAEHGILHR